MRWRLRHLAGDEGRLDELVRLTNERLQGQVPKIAEQQAACRKEIEEINATADGIIRQQAKALSGDARKFVQESLDRLMARREQLQEGLEVLERAAKALDRELVRKEAVRTMLADFDRVYGAIPPYKKRELVKAMIGQVRLSEVRLAVGLDGDPCGGLEGPEMGPEEAEPAVLGAVGAREAGSSGSKSGGPGLFPLASQILDLVRRDMAPGVDVAGQAMLDHEVNGCAYGPAVRFRRRCQSRMQVFQHVNRDWP